MNFVNVIGSTSDTSTQWRTEKSQITGNIVGPNWDRLPEITPERPLTGTTPDIQRAADAGPVTNHDEVISEEGTLPPDYEQVFRSGTSRRNYSSNDDRAELN